MPIGQKKDATDPTRVLSANAAGVGSFAQFHTFRYGQLHRALHGDDNATLLAVAGY